MKTHIQFDKRGFNFVDAKDILDDDSYNLLVGSGMVEDALKNNDDDEAVDCIDGVLFSLDDVAGLVWDEYYNDPYYRDPNNKSAADSQYKLAKALDKYVNEDLYLKVVDWES